MPFSLSTRAGLLAVLLSWPVATRADELPAPTPPAPRTSTDVPYPEGAQGDATVVLEIVVERDGSVSSAALVEGAEPFAEAARRAALGWHFAPAQRGNTPIAAKIRARVAFHQDEPAPVPRERAESGPAPARSPTAPATNPQKPAESPIDVTVVGVRREIGQTTLSASEVRELPGAFGDAFRAIEALPGVAPLVSGIPYFYVRGAPPNDSGYFVDGVRIPLLFHLGVGQSVIHPGLIERVDFFPSAAPARFGGSAGGVISGQTREPSGEAHGEANLRLIDAGALLEAPFAAGRGSALVAGRYGYPGPILNAVNSDIHLGYWDYQVRGTFRLNPRDSVGLFAFGSHDYLATRSPSGDPEARRNLVEQFVADFHRLDVRFDHAFDDGRVRFALTGGYERQGAAPTYVTQHSAAARIELERALSSTARLRAGAAGSVERYRIRLTASGPGEPVVPASANPPPTNLSGAFHADTVWRITPRVELVPGVRVAVFSSIRNNEAPSTGSTRTTLPAVDPRLSTRIELSPAIAWLSAFGLAHQYPSLRVGDVPAPVLSVPGFPFGDRKLQTAAQASEGFEFALPGEFSLTTTGFYSRFWGLTDLSASCFQVIPGMGPPAPGEVPPYTCPNNQPVRGHAYGLELLLRRPLSKRLSAWLSYTLSRSTRRARFITPEGGEVLATVASEFDRSHVVNAIASYDLGRRWRFGSRFLFYTGTPYSRLDGSIPLPPYNGYRGPNFFRLDVRLEKRWPLGKTGSIAFVAEGLNVTLSREVSGSLGMDCEGRGTPQSETNTCEPSKIGPITLPSVGVEAFF